MQLTGKQNIKTFRIVLNKQNKKCENVRTLPKFERNELCFCGSGLKYKNCHLKLKK